MSESFNIKVLDKITNDKPIKTKSQYGFFYYLKLSRESDESKKLGNFIFVLFLISLYCILTGKKNKYFIY